MSYTNEKEIYYLLSENEIGQMKIEIQEILDDLDEMLRKKKLTLTDNSNCKIMFDDNFLGEKTVNSIKNNRLGERKSSL